MMTTKQAAILERMRTASRSYGEIACRIGKSPGAVRWYCLRNGIESPRTGRRYDHVVPGSVQRRGNGFVRRYTPQEDALIEEMRTAGATIGKIASALGRSYSSVLGRLVTLAAKGWKSRPIRNQGHAMADIVERLRNDVLYVVPSIRLTEEAADEIERLRKANAAMRAWLQQICDIEQSDAVKGVYQLAAVHGTAYRGPHWDMDEVLRFLAQPEPQE